MSRAGAGVSRSGLWGWWAMHPAEEVNDFFVSDRASPFLFDELPRAGAALPTSIAPGVEQLGQAVEAGALLIRLEPEPVA